MNFIGKSSDAVLFAQEGLCRLLLRGATAASGAGRTQTQLPPEPELTLTPSLLGLAVLHPLQRQEIPHIH